MLYQDIRILRKVYSSKKQKKGGDKKMKESKPKTEGTVLYSYLSRKLASDGITQEEIDPIKDMPIGHHSVGDFIEANFQAGHFVRRGDRMFNANRELTLKFTKDEKEILETRAQESGISISEFASNAVIGALS